MKCPECDKQIEKKEGTCPHCGYDFEQAISTQGVTAGEDSQEKISTEDLSEQAEAQTEIPETIVLEKIKKTWKSISGTEDIGQTIKESGQEIKAPSQISIRETSIVRREEGPTEPPPDYEIIEKIGEGGMGVIYTARQSSVDRIVALKMVKGKEQQKQKDLFLSEAVATGNLDHPNIVPIIDLGNNKEGQLFYSMKNVTGTAWDAVIQEKSRQENLDILLRVCDAVAFAHSKGVIHRDLKPENVMLGEFGEVYVMDWGLAASVTPDGKAQPLDEKTALGGTVAYMAPEMGLGKMEKIGKHSDVYLLGAILYEIITGKTPHGGKTIYQCIYNVVENKIRETEQTGELIDIALKAMRRDPKERYGNIQGFQRSVREYQSHSESIRLSEEADKTLANVAEDYDSYANAIFGFRESLKIWKDNPIAQEGLEKAQISYAECAFQKGDFELALTPLSKENPSHKILIDRIEKAQKERNDRQKRIQTLRYASLGLVGLVLVILTVAVFWIKSEKERAESESNKAEAAREDEAKARKEAEIEKEKAVVAKIAEERHRKLADQEKKKALQENYFNVIRLAEQKIKDKQYDLAENLLNNTLPILRNWEWGRLNWVCHQDIETLRIPNINRKSIVGFTEDDSLIFVGYKNQIKFIDPNSGKMKLHRNITSQKYDLFPILFLPKRKMALFTNKDSKIIQLWNIETDKKVFDLANEKNLRFISFKASNDGNYLIAGGQHGARCIVRKYKMEDNSIGFEFTKSYSNVIAVNTLIGKEKVILAGSKGARIYSLENGREIFQIDDIYVCDAAFSPNDDLVCLGLMGGEIRIYNISEKAAIYRNLAHKKDIHNVEYSPSGNLLLTHSIDGIAKLWDNKTLKEVLNIETSDGIRSVGFSEDGGYIFCISGTNVIKYWDTKTMEAVTTNKMVLYKGDMVSFSMHKDIAIIAKGNVAELWDVLTGQKMFTLDGHQRKISFVKFLKNGEAVCTHSPAEEKAILWDVQTGKELCSIECKLDSLRTLTLSSDEKNITVAGIDYGDGIAKIWNVNNGKLKMQIEGHNYCIGSACMSNDNRYLLTGGSDNYAKLWDIDNGSEIQTFEGHSKYLTSASFSPDKKKVLTSSSDGTVKIWQASTGKELLSISKFKKWVTKALFFSNGSRIITACGSSLKIWDAETGEHRISLYGHKDSISDLALSKSGNKLLTSSRDGTLKLWDVRKNITKLKPQEYGLKTVSFSHSGKYIVCGNWDRSAVVYDSITEEEVIRLIGHDAPVYSVAISSDEQKVLTGSSDNTARIWDMKSGGVLCLLKGHSKPVKSVAFSSDDKLVLTGSADGTLAMWKTSTGSQIQTFLKYKGEEVVNSIAFIPNSKKVVSGGINKKIMIWDTLTGNIISELTGHSDSVSCLDVSPDGLLLLSGAYDGTAIVWDLKSGEIVHQLKGHDQPVICVSLSSDKKRIVTGSYDGSIKLWDTDTGTEIKSLGGEKALSSFPIIAVLFTSANKNIIASNSKGEIYSFYATPWGRSAERLTKNTLIMRSGKRSFIEKNTGVAASALKTLCGMSYTFKRKGYGKKGMTYPSFLCALYYEINNKGEKIKLISKDLANADLGSKGVYLPSIMNPDSGKIQYKQKQRFVPIPYNGYWYMIIPKMWDGKPYKKNNKDHFAICAFPADYGFTGIMTLIISDEGTVYSLDMGDGSPLEKYPGPDPMAKGWEIAQ